MTVIHTQTEVITRIIEHVYHYFLFKKEIFTCQMSNRKMEVKFLERSRDPALYRSKRDTLNTWHVFP